MSFSKYLIEGREKRMYEDNLSRIILKQELIENKIDDVVFRTWVRDKFRDISRKASSTRETII